MAHYLVQLSYTAESYAAQLKNPKNRIEAVKPVLDQLGARILHAYYALGDADLVFIVDAPSNVSVAAAAFAFQAGGAIKSYKTTPLMTLEEGVDALKKGGEAAAVYQVPR